MPDKGPFSVDPQQVEGLEGSPFADLVGRLLEAELASAGLAGTALTQTYRTNAPDGGVDAGLDSDLATVWVPLGQSAWQFKAGDLAPAACKTELLGATAALEVLKNGGSYRLALGRSLTPAKIAKRKAALEDAARSVGITVDAGTIEVLNADHLARWAEVYPAVAISPLIRGIGIIGQTFDEWSASVSHKTTWVASEARDKQIESLQEAIQSGDESGVHVEGVSGLGKTRLVMEALRGQPNQGLVIYVPSEDQFTPAVLSQLQTQGRSAVIIIDECDAKRHDIFAAMLQTGTKIRLVTVSEPSQRAARAATLQITAFEDAPLTELLQKNVPTLWPEATRVIVEVSAGNIDYALKCAKALVAQRPGTARQLIDPNDIRQFIVDELPGGTLFLASSALALFSRIGFDAELASELSILGEGLGVPEPDLRAAAADLASHGLLTTQGRYRSVGPHPVAIYLASNGWTEFGSRIVTDLLPKLSEDLTERLFRRAAEIGDSTLPRAVIDQMLGADGPLSSLEAVATDRRGNLLDHLAILSPERVSGRIAELLAETDDDDLRKAEGARRPLVWALQKLAWHTSTFTEAADSLLRLALVENESFSNNSTGVWVDLFGTMLPSTAASPAERLAYLRSKAAEGRPEIRALVVKAAHRALDSHEHTMVSGELQGGVVVEPRGAPKTWGESWEYRNAIIDTLGSLSGDSDADVAASAVKALTDAIHVSLGQPVLRDHLASTLASLPPEQLQDARAKLADLASLYDRTGDEKHHAEDIDAILTALPAGTLDDQLWVLAHASPWDRRNGDIETDFINALEGTETESATAKLLALLVKEVPTDFIIGRVLAKRGADIAATAPMLLAKLSGSNARALVGFLVGLEEATPGTYDEYVDQLNADPITKLRLTTQGPRTSRAEARAAELLPQISVAEGARAVFYWLRETSDDDLLRLYINDWKTRVESEDDYRALVDFLAFELHDRPEISPELQTAIEEIVELRLKFPVLGQQEYDWSQLAERQLEKDPASIVRILVELVEQDAISMYSDSQEKGLFGRALKLAGKETWIELLDRLAKRESWKLAFSTQGWVADIIDLDVIESWVGDSVDRAKTVASVASVGSDEINPVASFLLSRFGDERGVTSSLVGEFISGMWSGDESDRIKGQIAQVKRWLAQPGQSEGAKRWCRKLLEHLESRLGDVLQGEQEHEW
ncbi:hypothetical protein [Microbacterium sp.]|uniref:hypothetical protein n=1 Tax=Microbacterium sp. TaxID=51671 RepID=UPI00257D14B3|nr:hypothetical protein [Microbacterium sp.]